MTELFEEVYTESHLATTRKHVQAYRDMGLAVVPIELGTKDKFPCSWKQYQTTPPTGGQITEWFYSSSKTPYNVAAILGPVSGNLVAIDVDGEAGQNLFAKGLSDLGYCNNLRGVLLNTFMTRSGSRRGFHFLVRVDQRLLDDPKDGAFFRELLRPAKQDLWQGQGEHEAISLLSQGSVAILAPSVHPSGRTNFYVWNHKAPETIRTRKELVELFSMFRESPEKYLDNKKRQWRKQVKGYNGNSQSFEAATKILTSEQMDALLKVIIPEYRVGMRNAIVMGLSGDLYKSGYSCQTALDVVSMLCRATGDEEEQSRLDTVRRTYAKSAAEVKGLGILDDFS